MKIDWQPGISVTGRKISTMVWSGEYFGVKVESASDGKSLYFAVRDNPKVLFTTEDELIAHVERGQKCPTCGGLKIGEMRIVEEEDSAYPADSPNGAA